MIAGTAAPRYSSLLGDREWTDKRLFTKRPIPIDGFYAFRCVSILVSMLAIS
jgi:hypothetical protein